MHNAFIFPQDTYNRLSDKKRLKQKYRQEFLKSTFLPTELERGTKALRFDVCCKAISQNFDCGCDRYEILRLDTLTTG